MVVDVTFNLKPEPNQTRDTYLWEVEQMRRDMALWNARNPIPWVMRFVIAGGQSPEFRLPDSSAPA